MGAWVAGSIQHCSLSLRLCRLSRGVQQIETIVEAADTAHRGLPDARLRGTVAVALSRQRYRDFYEGISL
jgi:hypothetical protein